MHHTPYAMNTISSKLSLICHIGFTSLREWSPPLSITVYDLIWSHQRHFVWHSFYIWHFFRTCKCKFQLHLRSGWTFRVHSSQKLFVTIAVLQRMITWSHRPDCPAPLGTTHRPLCRKLWGLAPRVSLVNVFLLRSHEITLLSYWI